MNESASWIPILASQDEAISRCQTRILRCVHPEASQDAGISGRHGGILRCRHPGRAVASREAGVLEARPGMVKWRTAFSFEDGFWHPRKGVYLGRPGVPTRVPGRYNVSVTYAAGMHSFSLKNEETDPCAVLCEPALEMPVCVRSCLSTPR